MIPLYLVAERGMEQGQVNSLIAVSRMVTLGMGLLAGYAVDRIGTKQAMAVFLLVTGCLTALLGLVSDTWIMFVVFLQPMFAVCFFPAGFAVMARIGPADSRNLAVSLIIPVAFLLGAGAIPAGLGLLGEQHAFSLGFAILGGLVLAGSMLVRSLRVS